MNTDNTKMITMIRDISNASDEAGVLKVLFDNSKGRSRTYSKPIVLAGYKELQSSGKLVLDSDAEKRFLRNIRTKKVRTGSGVTPVTVLTKPFPCPGNCIYCPNDVKMPKSYLSSEPGAQRASDNKFDPYCQTYNRLVAFVNTGHPVSKVELIILGGTWTAYPKPYQIWFVKRCFDALNDFDPFTGTEYIKPDMEMPYIEESLAESSGNYNSRVGLSARKPLGGQESATWEELKLSHDKNVNASCRCTGLVLETRPDCINTNNVIEMRRLGATKIQLGVQSLDDIVLQMNKREHSVADTSKAFSLLRSAGFKIHIHWMSNLYGSDPEKDIQDFSKLFEDDRFRPDELKIYPCSLIEGTELLSLYKEKKWKPYGEDQLLDVLKFVLKTTPRYCRITRVVRDISSDDIVAGNKKTNFRQYAETALIKENVPIVEIRHREIKDRIVERKDLRLIDTVYKTSGSEEHFLEFVTSGDKIVGFLRLSLPVKIPEIDELKDSAIIREVHVYGGSLDVGKQDSTKTQHLGLGKELIVEATKISQTKGFRLLSVISAIGTRSYYEKNGFIAGDLYQHLKL